MKLKNIDEEDRATREIRNSLRDIENFKNSNYEEMLKVNEEHREEVKRIVQKAKVSTLTATELLKEKED